MDTRSVAPDIAGRTHRDDASEARVRPRSRTGTCAGCGTRYPYRELVELTEDNHDDLTYFHGDRLCTSCADGAGVSR